MKIPKANNQQFSLIELFTEELDFFEEFQNNSDRKSSRVRNLNTIRKTVKCKKAIFYTITLVLRLLQFIVSRLD